MTRDRSIEIIRLVHKRAEITTQSWAGGIDGPQSAWDAITSGATLIQLYSALVFNGPAGIKEAIGGLKRRLQQEGILNLHDAIGIFSDNNR